MRFAGTETEQMLAPRRQSLPQPHTSPLFIPSWAPTGPDSSANRTKLSTSASCQSLHDRPGQTECKPDEGPDTCSGHDAAVSTPPDLPARRRDHSFAAASMSASRQSTHTDQWSGDPQHPSPGRQLYKAAPAVNIIINGPGPCLSPAKTSPGTEAHEQASPPAERLNAAKLTAEASLAYLHQRAGSSGQAAYNSSTGDAGAVSIDAVSPCSVCQGDLQDASGRRGADQAGSSSIDTAALQKEVTELRQQARVHSPTCT